MSGVLATAALKIFMMFLPTVLHFIITTTLHLKAEENESKTSPTKTPWCTLLAERNEWWK